MNDVDRIIQWAVVSIAAVMATSLIVFVSVLLPEAPPSEVVTHDTRDYAPYERPPERWPEYIEQGGNNYFVSPNDENCSDLNPGNTVDRPWCTIRRVNQAMMQPGDDLYLRAGSTFNAPLTINWSGTPTDTAVVGSYTVRNGRPIESMDEHAMIVGPDSPQIDMSASHHVTAQDLTLDGSVQWVSDGVSINHTDTVPDAYIFTVDGLTAPASHLTLTANGTVDVLGQSGPVTLWVGGLFGGGTVTVEVVLWGRDAFEVTQLTADGYQVINVGEHAHIRLTLEGAVDPNIDYAVTPA